MIKHGFAGQGFAGRLLAGVALLLVPAVAGAQDVRDLDAEQSNVRNFTGNVGSEPAVFEVSIAAQTVLKIDVITTSELDPTVKVTDAFSGEVLAEDDDSGGDLNSRVTIPGADGRRVRIEVSRFSYDGMEEAGYQSGSFDLRLTSMVQSPQTLRNVTWGSALGGTLLGDDEHQFAFEGVPGQLLEVALLRSEDGNLDPYLELRDPAGDVVASNDDSGGNLNSLLRHVMQASGTYTITARDYGSNGGDYTLRVAEQRELVVQAPLQVISIGDHAEGRLGTGYENGDIDPAEIMYQLSEETIADIVSGDGEVTIRMTAAEGGDSEFNNGLDPYVELGFDTPLGFASVDSDDDSGGSLNAMLPIDLSNLARDPALLARLRIKVKSFSSTGGGYSLHITEGLELRPAYEEGAEEISPPMIHTVPSIPPPAPPAPPRLRNSSES